MDEPIVFHDVTLTQLSQKVLIVGDDNQLEVGMTLAFVDNADSEESCYIL